MNKISGKHLVMLLLLAATALLTAIHQVVVGNVDLRAAVAPAQILPFALWGGYVPIQHCPAPRPLAAFWLHRCFYSLHAAYLQLLTGEISLLQKYAVATFAELTRPFNISVTLGDRPGLGYVGQSSAQYPALHLFAANIIGEVAAAARSTDLVVCHF